MFFCMLFPLVGIIALLFGFVEPGDGNGSMTTMQVTIILAGFSLSILVLWKLFSITLNWIARSQIALLFNDQ